MTLAAYGRRGNAACNLLGELLELRKKCDSIISADAKSLRKAARALSEHWRTKPIRDPLPPHYKCGPLRFHSYEDLHLFDWLCAMARPRVANVLWLLFRAIEERDAKVFEHIASIIKHTPPNEPLSELADSDAYQMAREQLVDDKFSVSAHSLDELRDLTKSRASDRTMSRKARSLGLKLKERWPSNHGT